MCWVTSTWLWSDPCGSASSAHSALNGIGARAPAIVDVTPPSTPSSAPVHPANVIAIARAAHFTHPKGTGRVLDLAAPLDGCGRHQGGRAQPHGLVAGVRGDPSQLLHASDVQQHDGDVALPAAVAA